MNFFNIKPSAYQWLFPNLVDAQQLDDLFDQDKFPSLNTFFIAALYAAALGLVRAVLQPLVFKVIMLFPY